MSANTNMYLSRDEILKTLRLLTLKEVLYITKLGRTKIWQLIRAGKLKPCPNTGRALRFTHQALVDCFGIALPNR
jgi:predicted DNA-binding transcriptional regulator AlpA